MKTILAATAAMGLAIAAVPAAAQMSDDMGAEEMAPMEMNAQQQAKYDAWPKGKQLAYDGWTDETKTYFWTLAPAEMTAWWLLTPDQQSQLMAMSPEAQARAWTSIKSQVATTSTGTAATTGTSSGTMNSNSGMASTTGTTASGDTRYVSNEMVQNTPKAQKPVDGEYPVCSKNVTDNCVNPYAVGKGGNKPLGYWPGKPASES